MKTTKEHYATRSIQAAIASEIAKRVRVTDEMITAKENADEATEVYRQMIQVEVEKQLRNFLR